MLKVGSDFSGVGAFNQALMGLGIEYHEVFACDMDKYARETFIHNYGEPEYYPKDVYERDIPSESLDIYMTSPPCQAFSLAGKRKGEEDKRGILFYNSHEFIKINRPRYFIFENVKGLLSDDGGITFRRWCEYLGGKSINGNPVIFPHEESVPYHIYFKVLNAKDYNIPQNRERVFIVGIRDDEDNQFTWPKEIFLEKRLRDVLEQNVPEKYFLEENMQDGFISVPGNDVHNIVMQVGYINQNTQGSKVYSDEHIAATICAGTHGYSNGYVKVKSATKVGYEIAEIGEDSINFEHPKSTTRRGRVGKGVAQTLTTSCNQGVYVSYNHPKVKHQLKGGKWDKTHEQSGRVYDENGISPTIHTMSGGGQEPKICDKERIRKFTPRECFRLMDFPDSFDFSVVSDSQAYKQAGNSICVGVLAKIIDKLKLNVSKGGANG